MTPKQKAAAIDPAYFKAERRQTRRFWGSLLMAIVSIIGATYAAVETHQNSTEITQIQHSACQVEPAGHECQQAKRESSRAASIATTCIPFFKAGYPCPKPGSTAAERQARRKGQAGSGAAQELNSGSGGEGRRPQAAAAKLQRRAKAATAARQRLLNRPDPGTTRRQRHLKAAAKAGAGP